VLSPASDIAKIENTNMVALADLRERLKKIEALVEGAGTPAERDAAEAALARVRAKLDTSEPPDEPVEQRFEIVDDWSRHLFVALCRRNGLQPYRRANEDRGVVTVRAPRNFMEGTLWRQYVNLDAELRSYLNEVSLRIIRDEVHADASDAHEIQEALPPPPLELTLEVPPEEPPQAKPTPKPWFGFGSVIRFKRRAGRGVRTRH
jgi:hypothetical protein